MKCQKIDHVNLDIVCAHKVVIQNNEILCVVFKKIKLMLKHVFHMTSFCLFYRDHKNCRISVKLGVCIKNVDVHSECLFVDILKYFFPVLRFYFFVESIETPFPIACVTLQSGVFRFVFWLTSTNPHHKSYYRAEIFKLATLLGKSRYDTSYTNEISALIR